jgi:hypothetical protein
LHVKLGNKLAVYGPPHVYGNTFKGAQTMSITIFPNRQEKDSLHEFCLEITIFL